MRGAGLALAVAYPFLVFAGVRADATRLVGAVLLAAVAARGLALLRGAEGEVRRRLLAPALALALPAAGAAATDDARILLLVPLAAHGALLVAFARTLRGPGPSMAETFARLSVADLSPAEVQYCRRVTALWCTFFAANAGIVAALAARGALEAWTLWTGLLSYVALGLLFAAEYTVRKARFRRYHGAVTDPLFHRLFPPREGCGAGAADAGHEPRRDQPSSGSSPAR